MDYLWFLIAGAVGGILGGMGMGGGTVTIPLLVLVGGVPQKIAQSANLFAFLPMSLCSLSVHKKNGLLETTGMLPVVLGALVSAAAGAFLVAFLPARMLRKGFGAFLIVLAFFTFRSAFRQKSSVNA